ncbi:uncharacterized protein LOC129919474 [Episyrphus balteatus]|uniref:uncharacterized protein LOC129919474 n=1 Tax=Episyrphus balteatus TaxID=286459 RepID=UPI002485ECFE|nr:uncharacterized protein LOC129919474 [Episyrphus balteatus]
MFKVFVCVFVLAVAAVSADYDFKDSEFNELLFDDFQSALDDEEALRFRRDTETADGHKECMREKHNKDKNNFCCNGKADEAHLEVMKEVRKECMAQVRGPNPTSYDPFDCEQVKAMKEQCVCTAECISKRFNLIDEHGELKRELVLVNLRAKLGDQTQWKPEAIEGLVDNCLGELNATKEMEAKKNESLEKESREEKVGCNPYPLQFYHCFWREAVQRCPAELQSDHGKCKKIREALAKGDKSIKPFLHHFGPHGDDKKSWD